PFLPSSSVLLAPALPVEGAGVGVEGGSQDGSQLPQGDLSGEGTSAASVSTSTSGNASGELGLSVQDTTTTFGPPSSAPSSSPPHPPTSSPSSSTLPGPTTLEPT